MRFGALLHTVLAQLLLVLSCHVLCWQAAVPETDWLAPAATVEHLSNVCELSGEVQNAHPFVHLGLFNEDAAGLGDWQQDDLQAGPPFPLAAARFELSGESEPEPTTRSADSSVVAHALRYLCTSRARPPSRQHTNDIARHQVSAATADPAQTAGPRPPPLRHHRA